MNDRRRAGPRRISRRLSAPQDGIETSGGVGPLWGRLVHLPGGGFFVRGRRETELDAALPRGRNNLARHPRKIAFEGRTGVRVCGRWERRAGLERIECNVPAL